MNSLSVRLRLHELDVGVHHVGDELVEPDCRLPAEKTFGFARVALKLLHLRRAVVLRVHLHSNDPEFWKKN